MNSSVVALPPLLVAAQPRMISPEGVVAHLVAQRLQRHRATHVDGVVEEQVHSRVADHDRPERVVRGNLVVARLEGLLRSGAAFVVLPEPLGVRGETLVEPDVLPARERDIVAEPLMSELMYDHGVAVDGVALVVEPEKLRVDRPGLGLEREEEVVLVVDDRTHRAERVRPEGVAQQVEDLALARQGGIDLLRAGRR